jgi:hypothetical protein
VLEASKELGLAGIWAEGFVGCDEGVMVGLFEVVAPRVLCVTGVFEFCIWVESTREASIDGEEGSLLSISTDSSDK